MRNRTLNLAAGCRAHSASDDAVLRATGNFSKLVVNGPSRDTLNQTSSEPAGSLEVAPSFSAARYNCALLLQITEDSPRALVQIEQCLEADPEKPSYRNLAAVILSRVGEFDRASEIYARLLAEYPENARVWLSYGMS